MVLSRIILSFVFVFAGMQALADSTQIERGKQVYDKLDNKYSDIMKPIIAGIATSTPVLRICVPDTEWKKLEDKNKVSLTFYLESLIPAVRNNPDPYITIYHNAPIYDTFRSRAKNLCDDCWAIMECSWNTERKSWSLDRTLVQGDMPWYKDNPCCRGVKGSEFRAGQQPVFNTPENIKTVYSPDIKCGPGYKKTYFANPDRWKCIKECPQGYSFIYSEEKGHWICE